MLKSASRWQSRGQKHEHFSIYLLRLSIRPHVFSGLLNEFW